MSSLKYESQLARIHIDECLIALDREGEIKLHALDAFDVSVLESGIIMTVRVNRFVVKTPLILVFFF